MKICPLCKTKNTYFLIKKIWKYYVCNKCKTAFISNTPSHNYLKKFYTKTFKKDVSVNKHNLIKHYRAILKNLKKINSDGKTLLDIGVGDGSFIKEALNFNLKVTGIEPSLYFYKKLITFKNIKIINKTFEDFLKKNKLKFDFITLIHVIEHVRNPIFWIKKLKKILKKDGVLFIETPNLNSYLFFVEKENYTFLTPPEHIWIFSISSFYQILKKIPSIKIISSSTYSHPEHLIGIIKKIVVSLLTYKAKNKKYILSFNEKKLIKKNNFFKEIKFNLINKFLAPFLTPILNLGGLGSILELYIKKK